MTEEGEHVVPQAHRGYLRILRSLGASHEAVPTYWVTFVSPEAGVHLHTPHACNGEPLLIRCLQDLGLFEEEIGHVLQDAKVFARATTREVEIPVPVLHHYWPEA